MWLHWTTKAVQALPAVDKWRHANYCQWQTKPKNEARWTLQQQPFILRRKPQMCARQSHMNPRSKPNVQDRKFSTKALLCQPINMWSTLFALIGPRLMSHTATGITHYAYLWTHTYIHTHTYIYRYICTYVHKYIHIQQNNVTPYCSTI